MEKSLFSVHLFMSSFIRSWLLVHFGPIFCFENGGDNNSKENVNVNANASLGYGPIKIHAPCASFSFL
jgi:hypothetical protein